MDVNDRSTSTSSKVDPKIYLARIANDQKDGSKDVSELVRASLEGRGKW